MKVIIADTLPASIANLDLPSQAQVKQTVFDFQVNPEHPSFQYHRIENSKDRNFWSIRVSRDIRIIVHRNGDTNVLCYADHHDPAYRWAEKRRLDVHPDTGVAQMVVFDERVEEVVKRVIREVEEESPVFGKYDRDYLQALGVPEEFLDPAKYVGESNLMDFLGLLPQEAGERLCDLAAGKPVPRPVRVKVGPFENPDAQRRFMVVGSNDELRHALEAGWDKWTVFLHPSQRAAVKKAYAGPAKITGSAGTGKSVVALHRAAHLARNGRGPVLLTTFSLPLSNHLTRGMDQLIARDDPARQRITIVHLHKLARDLWVQHNRRNLKVVTDRQAQLQHLTQADRAVGGSGFPIPFARAEWDGIILPFNIRTWDQYRTVSRAGRGVSLGAQQRRKLWSLFEKAYESFGTAGLLAWDQVCHEVAALLERFPDQKFAHVVADEVQDFGYADLVLLRALAPEGEDDLFLCGDPGQRIYKHRSSWAAAGVNVRGRSTRLRVNYRTTEEIRKFASSLLADSIEDGDGELEPRETDIPS